MRSTISAAFACMLVVSGVWAADRRPLDPLRDACDADAAYTVLQPAAGEAVDAQAIWLTADLLRWPGVAAPGQFRLHHSAQAQLRIDAGRVVDADRSFELERVDEALPSGIEARFAWAGDGVLLRVPAADRVRVAELLRGHTLLTRTEADRRVQQVSAIQHAAALDALYADRAEPIEFGAHADARRTRFSVWAPTAQAVALCLHDDGRANASAVQPMRRDPGSGAWSFVARKNLSGRYYTYLVDVVVPGIGLVRNRVTDPYAVSLSTNSTRAYIADLDADALKPAAWDRAPHAKTIGPAVDQVIYEVHLRDFSINDATVTRANRGKYLAFTESESNGLRHLRALADAGLSDVHLLPVFDFATVPEAGCVTASVRGSADGEAAQAAIESVKAQDCFNWGYDPLHFNAPEGSYASDAADGARRIVEFRRMVQSLHALGLRVGMDVVYNHTSASGQHANSVLDRIVPGYYHRLDARGRVTTSTCCANTATEQRMMAKLMIDSVVLWARDYRIDSFRFDLMGHQPRAAMQRLQHAVDAATGRHIHLLGEGWNFGEVADGARFVQASQLSLNGSGIATFSDRARDAIRGGGPGDNDARLVSVQGYVNGLHYDANAHAARTSATDLMRTADMVRVGLAGSLRDYRLRTYSDEVVPLSAIRYGGRQPAGYVSEPGEVVNYVENHDNQTLFDINALKLPTTTSRDDRARVQLLAVAINLFSQGVAYFHAGVDLLRSKSLDRNSYDSGDWFNRIDWSYQDNHYASGLPPRQDNAASWDLMRPLLANPEIKPGAAEIAWTRDVFRDLLRIRASSTLFRLRSAADIRARLRFVNTGSKQEPTVIAALLDGHNYRGAGFVSLAYFINVDRRAHQLDVPEAIGVAYQLHPVHRARRAADRRPIEASHFDRERGRFTVPARTAVVFVVE